MAAIWNPPLVAPARRLRLAAFHSRQLAALCHVARIGARPLGVFLNGTADPKPGICRGCASSSGTVHLRLPLNSFALPTQWAEHASGEQSSSGAPLNRRGLT